MKGKQDEWKAIVEKYRINQDIDLAINEFLDNDWVKLQFNKRNPRQIQLFKEHVRQLARHCILANAEVHKRKRFIYLY